MRASLASRSLAAFPVSTAGRPPHQSFRGLLGVHLVAACVLAESPNGDPFASECFSPCRYLHEPLRLLPAGTTVCRAGFAPAGGQCLSTAHADATLARGSAPVCPSGGMRKCVEDCIKFARSNALHGSFPNAACQRVTRQFGWHRRAACSDEGDGGWRLSTALTKPAAERLRAHLTCSTDSDTAAWSATPLMQRNWRAPRRTAIRTSGSNEWVGLPVFRETRWWRRHPSTASVTNARCRTLISAVRREWSSSSAKAPSRSTRSSRSKAVRRASEAATPCRDSKGPVRGWARCQRLGWSSGLFALRASTGIDPDQ